MWKAIAEFVASIFLSLWPEIKKPKEVENIGYDEEVEDDIDAEIDSEFDFLGATEHKEDKVQPNVN